MVVESYGDDLTTDDLIKLTLPTGVVFSSDWLPASVQTFLPSTGNIYKL